MSSVKLHWNYKGVVVHVDDQRSPPGGLISVFTVNFVGLLSADYQLLSSSASWGCEGGKDRNSQRTERLSVVSGILKTNVNVDLTIMITPLGTNVFLTQSALLYLPRSSKDFVLETDCLGKIVRQEWTEFADMGPLNIQLDYMSNPDPTFSLTPALVSEYWMPNPRAGLNAFWSFHIEKSVQ